MNRLTKAWKALRGTLEPEVRVEKETVLERHDVYGDAVKVTVFRAEWPRYGGWYKGVGFGVPVSVDPPDWHGNYYATCAQAFAECPGANVVEVNVLRIAGDYYQTPKVSHIKLQPKPKRPKGRA